MTTDNTTYRDKGRAVLLAAMMVLSVVAMSAAFAGAATASHDTTRAAGNVDNGDTVFQGEDVELTGTLSGETLLAVGGNNEGAPLDIPIPEDQAVGSYTTDGQSGSNGITVQQPRISDITVTTQGGSGTDVDGSTVTTGNADNLQVQVDFNFDQAEDVEITVEDEDGLDITNQVAGSETIHQSGDTVTLDLQNEDAGDYTITAEGSDDLDFGSAVDTTTVGLTTDKDLGLSMSTDTATRGDNVQYTVEGGSDEDTHYVAIESSDLADSYSAGDTVFRNVGDTVNVGNYQSSGEVQFVWAEVEIDGTEATGSIETQNLDETSVDVEVYGSGATEAGIDSGTDTSEDDVSFDVTEGDITVDSPGDTYTIGSEVDINGTASSSEEVAVYVRDNSDWQLLESGISVDSDDTFEVEDYILSSDGQTNILQLGGTYRFGVIDASDADTGGAAGADSSLSTSNFNQGTSVSQSIRAVEGDLSADFVTIGGEIAEDPDGDIDVNGTATGQNSVAVIFVDQRGTTVAKELSVDNDGSFEEEGIDITPLSQGSVSAHIVSQGRDDGVGDGEVPTQPNAQISNLVTWADNLGGSLSGEQVRDRIASETVDDTASDDRMVTENFRFADGSTTIDSVYPQGAEASGVNPVAVDDETMVIEGMTNLQPDDNTITVEVMDGDRNSQEISSTDAWETNGQWSIEVPTENLDVGTYTVESDDGDNTDRAEIEIVEEREDPDDGSSDDGSSDDGSSDDGSSDDGSSDDGSSDDGSSDDGSSDDGSSDDGSSDDGSSDDGSSDDGTPGFGVGVALVALLGAALVALRRDN